MKKIKRGLILVYIVLLLSILFQTEFDINAISCYTSNLSIQEETRLKELVSRKLNISKFNYEFISGFNSYNRYVLVEGIGCYLIYDRELSDYSEYSIETNSIYSDLDSTNKKYYFGPLFYFSMKNNSSIENLQNGNSLRLEDLESYKEVEEEMTKNYILNKQIAQSFSNENVLNVSPSPPVYLKYKYFFHNLSNNMGTNTTNNFSGSCAYVALGMLLSYYDTTANDNVIFEQRDVAVSRDFDSSEVLNASVYNQSPGIDDTFHFAMINLGRDMGLTKENEFSAAASDLMELLEAYLDGRHLSYTMHSTGIFTDKKKFCEEAIRSNNPVIISIKGTDNSIAEGKINHAVIGHGYDDTGIYVNFGWKGLNKNVNINNYTIYHAYYIDLNENHTCSNNYLWTRNGCSGTLCPCGSVVCNHLNRLFIKYNINYHKDQCQGCGSYILKEHTFSEFNGNQICVDCKYKVGQDHRHTFTYQSGGDGINHIAACNCGYSKIEPCMGLASGDGNVLCIKCGQKINGGSIILSEVMTCLLNK